MAFGKGNTSQSQPTQCSSESTHISETQNIIDVDEEVQQQPQGSTGTATTQEKDATKPLLEEITFIAPTGNKKNTGGTKTWVCNHCNQKFNSSYTRIHAHFFGSEAGKKHDIQRCKVICKDSTKYNALFNKVKEAETSGAVAKSLKNSVLSKNASSKRKIEESFAVLERNAVDMKIVRGLCANGIPFNVLRNPQFLEMIQAITKAPDGYKPPSYEKARTSLLDLCKREVEKELAPVKDTWLTQGCGTGNREDMAKQFTWLSETYTRGKGIVKFFLNHTHALSFFRENSKLQSLKVAKTRFASHYILLKRLTECREALATTIVLTSWREWVNKGDEHTRLLTNKVADTIKDDDFWDDIDHILAITKPIYYMIKFCDGEGPKIGEIYERMDNMIGQIKDAMSDNKFSFHFDDIKAIVVARWDKMTIPLHCLAFALSPRFYDKHYLAKLAPGGMERRPPNQDSEVIVGVMQAFERIAETKEEEKKLREQFAMFNMKKGIFVMAGPQADAVTMEATDWWSSYGAQTPDLMDVAIKVLSQPISSSSAERNWSTYSHIHNIKRNRLNGERADKLVFIHSNIRLISRFSESYTSGPNKKWDINPESDFIEGSSARLEEMTWENLDDEGMENERGKRQRNG